MLDEIRDEDRERDAEGERAPLRVEEKVDARILTLAAEQCERTVRSLRQDLVAEIGKGRLVLSGGGDGSSMKMTSSKLTCWSSGELRCQPIAVALFCARVTSAATSSGTNPVIGAPSASRLSAWHSVSLF